MAATWALACGFSAALPFFYPVFFVAMILHRARRDEARCRAKYGADWTRYCAIVPHRFLPAAGRPRAQAAIED
jgi:protein-S-isoprenylcysteine O-methyltransferase Ste14